MIKSKPFIICVIILSVFFFAGHSYTQECIDSTFLFQIQPGANQPSDIVKAPGGNFYLVDGVNHRIIVIDGKGKTKLSFGTKGDGKGEFDRPMGIDISEDGKVFVADSGNHRIQVFDLSGKFLYKFPVRSEPGERPADPVDVLASKLKNYLYISDNDNHKIRVYKQNGDFDFQWGKFGEGPGEFRYPGILAANQFNEVLVVDVLNTRVQKFDPFGHYISDIGSWGVVPGKLFRPKGIAIDKTNRVFISDSYMGVVQVFTDLGRFLGIVCENGKNRKFTTPVGMTMDDAGENLLVVEMRQNRVSVLKLLPK